MVRLLRLIEKFLKGIILDSFLSQTLPLTRFAVSIALSICIFSSDYLALGIITTIVLAILFTSLDTVRENWKMVILPLIIGAVMAVVSVFYPGRMSYLGVEPGLLIWRFLLLCLAAAIWLILLPQKDLVVLVRVMPFPQIWVGVLAAFRGAEIGTWALTTVERTIRTKRLRIFRHGTIWFDAVLTGIICHFIEFLNGFSITLRTRGVESEYTPRDARRQVGPYDCVAYVLCVLGAVGVFWT